MKYVGYNTAVAKVREMSRDQLIDVIDTLFGWDHMFETFNLPISQIDTETIRREALRQVAIDWEDCHTLNGYGSLIIR